MNEQNPIDSNGQSGLNSEFIARRRAAQLPDSHSLRLTTVPFQLDWTEPRRAGEPHRTGPIPFNEIIPSYINKFNPVLMAEWALTHLYVNETVEGLYPWQPGEHSGAGRFAVRRRGNDVFGFLEAGRTHYLFRPGTIHVYAMPFYYQRPLAVMGLSDMLKMFEGDVKYQLDLSAKAVYILTAGETEELKWVAVPQSEHGVKTLEGIYPAHPAVLAHWLSEQVTRAVSDMVGRSGNWLKIRGWPLYRGRIRATAFTNNMRHVKRGTPVSFEEAQALHAKLMHIKAAIKEHNNKDDRDMFFETVCVELHALFEAMGKTLQIATDEEEEPISVTFVSVSS